jgi:hypothetical protein
MISDISPAFICRIYIAQKNCDTKSQKMTKKINKTKPGRQSAAHGLATSRRKILDPRKLSEGFEPRRHRSSTTKIGDFTPRPFGQLPTNCQLGLFKELALSFGRRFAAKPEYLKAVRATNCEKTNLLMMVYHNCQN